MEGCQRPTPPLGPTMQLRIPPRLIAALLLLLGAVGWAYGPILAEFSANIWRHKAHYQHFPFLILGAAALGVRQLVSDAEGSAPARFWAPIGAVLAWVLLLAALTLWSPLFAAVSLILLVGAGGCLVCRAADRPFPMGPWLLLWLVLPPPVGLDYQLIQTLQRQSSVLASQALDVLRVNHLMEGNALVLPDKTLFVDEACSGVVSAVSIVSCAALYGVWRRRGLAHSLLLMALGAGWAMLLNVVRIVSIALAHELAGWDWAEGFSHTCVGLGAFALGLVAIVTTDWLLKAMLAEIGSRWSLQTGEPLHFGRWLVNFWDDWVATPDEDPALEPDAPRATLGPRFWSRLATGSIGMTSALVASVAFATVGGLNLTHLGAEKPTVNFPQAAEVADALMQEGVLPEELDGLRLVGVEHQQRSGDSLFAQHSIVYSYESTDGDRYLLSCDFPYVGGWHELSVCYQGIGWELNDRRLTLAVPSSAEVESSGATALGDGVEVALLDLTKPDGRAALVVFGACFVDGSPAPAPARTMQESLLNALSGRRNEKIDRHSFQVQVLAERAGDVSDHDRGESLRLLTAALAPLTKIMTAPR